MTASRAGRGHGRGRERRADTERPADPRTNTTPAIEIRDDGDRTNVVAESDNASLIVAWNSGEVGIDALLDLLDGEPDDRVTHLLAVHHGTAADRAIEASIIETRLRATESLLKEQAAER